MVLCNLVVAAVPLLDTKIDSVQLLVVKYKTSSLLQMLQSPINAETIRFFE